MRSRRVLAMVSAFAIVLAGAALLYRRAAPEARVTAHTARSLVVLPMENRTGDSAQAYLATGLADNIAKRLEGIGGIRIRSGARSEWPTATRHDLEMVANKLGSTYLLKTVLTRSGDSLDLSAYVVDMTSTAEKAIARRRFTTSELRDVEGDVAARIAAAIFGAALPADPNPAARPPNPESYRLTLEGWHWFSTLGQKARARDLFQQAVALDPLNARAWSGLSSAWYSMGTGGQIPLEVGHQQAEAAALHALALDSSQGSAWANLGFMRAIQYRSLSTGLALIQKGIERDPGNAEVFLLKAALYRSAWRWNDSRDALRFARQLDPISPNYARLDAQNQMCAGQNGAALGVFDTLLARLPTDSLALRGRVRALARLGRFDDAIRAWRESSGLRPGDPLAAKLLVARGESGYWDAMHLEGRQRLSRLRERAGKGWVSPAQLVFAHFAAGDMNEGYRQMEGLIKSGQSFDRLPCTPELDEARGSPRLAAIQARVGHLPP
ncbi:MAG: hypothetical protein H0W68_06355 [Gemmatimonadaceae bacterium]|nr:hypothetical protein [Gemmatimonadaceae bacterium]